MEFEIELRIESDAERQGKFKIVRVNEYGEKCFFDWFLINGTEKEVLIYPSFQTLTLLGVELKDKRDFGTYLKLLKKFGIELRGGYKSHWKPEDGTDFYWIDDSGHVQENNYCNDFAFRRGNYNAFPTYGLAEMARNVSKLERLILLWQYNNGCLFEPDWIMASEKYYITYNWGEEKIVATLTRAEQTNIAYFESKAYAEEFIIMYEKEIKELLGIGDKP